ncbi:hypothetical protein [Ruegeria sp. ANG-R]|uniref:hypothetical protein n=1 Tax=Ruegeria sp. ANG-R TaxID=1577903 RepID=UPI000AC07FC5|nr:hypothetical protein [Ruegeria sp. ANG-R]
MARVERKKIRQLAGNSYVDGSQIADKIQLLKHGDERFIFGIFENSEQWTVLSVQSLFAAFDGKKTHLNIIKDGAQIHRYFGVDGNKHASDVVLPNGNKIWMKSVGLSSSIQNIMLMLQKLPEGSVLES